MLSITAGINQKRKGDTLFNVSFFLVQGKGRHMSNHQLLLKQGWQQHQTGRLDQAEHKYQQVIADDPKNADAWVFMGILQFDQRQFESSTDSYRKALKLKDHYPIAWNNLGNSLRMLGSVDEAEKCFIQALSQQPNYLSAFKNRGTLWIWAGEIEKGLKWYQEGLKHHPDEVELHRNLGVIHLLLGNYDIGWPEYRWRWKFPGMYRPATDAPTWKGEPLENKTILLYPEQGLGDAIQFIRVANELTKQGARVYAQVGDRLEALFCSAPGIDRLLNRDQPLPRFDYHASFIEVIDYLYQATGEIAWGSDLFKNLPGYLRVSDALIDYWRQWFAKRSSITVPPTPTGSKRLRVGINWQGNPDHHADVYRSIPLEILAPLTTIDHVELYSLQFGFGSEQLTHSQFNGEIVKFPEHVDTDGGAFTDTAAILRNLDVVVTTDTSVTHLAGAVGTKTYLLLGKVPDWRWLRSGSSTPWYPHMRLFRQSKLGAWDEPVAEVASLLRKTANAG